MDRLDGAGGAASAVDGALVGYIYGFPLPPQKRWWDGIHETAPPGFTDEDGRRTFAVSELLVRSDWRRRGIAKALHDDLLADRPEARTTLLVRPENAVAQTAYRSWGWIRATEIQPNWEEAPTFVVLVRTPATPDLDR